MRRIRFNLDAKIWTGNLILFAVALFLERFGQGLLNGVRVNFFVDTLGLSSGQVLLLEGLRELPGLILIFLAALTMHMALSRQAAMSVALMGIGYALFAFVHSYTALLAAEIIASFGFHLWTPLNSAIGMSLSSKENTGRVLGNLASVGALASIAGVGAITLISFLLRDMPLGNYYLGAGSFMVLAALLIWRLPKNLGAAQAAPARILVRKRYWLYYVLIFFSGARKLVLNSFVTLVLVKYFGLQVWQTSGLMLVSNVLNLLLAPYLGSLVDRFGERIVTPLAYMILVLACIGFAIVDNPWVLAGLWLVMRITATLGMTLSTYVYRTAPAEELAPTLSAGVTFDHISSVGMPFAMDALLPQIGYQGILWAGAALILMSIPFARALQVRLPVAQPAASGTE